MVHPEIPELEDDSEPDQFADLNTLRHTITHTMQVNEYDKNILPL